MAAHNFTFLPVAYLKGEFVPFEKANVSIATHALHYGTGAFGGVRGIVNENTKEVTLFRLDKHIERLVHSASFLKYELSPAKVREAILEFIQLNKPKTSFYIRPLVYISSLGISPQIHNDKDLLMYGLELGDYLDPNGVTACFSSWMRQEDRSFPLRAKVTGAYITSSLAKTEAMERGYDEAILMNAQGKVSEASGMNVFIVRDGKIITPGVDQDILEGITRNSVIEIARNEGFEVIERPVDKTELYIADEVFLTGTAAKVTPLNKIEGHVLTGSRKITNMLMDKMTRIYNGEDPNYEHWITRVQL